MHPPAWHTDDCRRAAGRLAVAHPDELTAISRPLEMGITDMIVVICHPICSKNAAIPLPPYPPVYVPAP